MHYHAPGAVLLRDDPHSLALEVRKGRVVVGSCQVALGAFTV